MKINLENRAQWGYTVRQKLVLVDQVMLGFKLRYRGKKISVIEYSRPLSCRN